MASGAGHAGNAGRERSYPNLLAMPYSTFELARNTPIFNVFTHFLGCLLRCQKNGPSQDNTWFEYTFLDNLPNVVIVQKCILGAIPFPETFPKAKGAQVELSFSIGLALEMKDSNLPAIQENEEKTG